jgi:hypothetical protein
MRTQNLTRLLAAALATTTFAGAVLTAGAAAAQPRPYGGAGYYGEQRYFSNGRWVDQRAWEAQRQREWSGNRYRTYRNDSNGDALAAGIIGFALGAAIRGDQYDSARSYSYRGDRNHVASCRARYPSYDQRSDTYLGPDRFRHYCG